MLNRMDTNFNYLALLLVALADLVHRSRGRSAYCDDVQTATTQAWCNVSRSAAR